MNSFLRIFKKHKIKRTCNIKPCSNPPKKTILKTKPLLSKNSKKKSKETSAEKFKI